MVKKGYTPEQIINKLREGLKVPKKQPKRSRLWLSDGSCIRLRPEHKDHVWSYDFVKSHTAGGGQFQNTYHHR